MCSLAQVCVSTVTGCFCKSHELSCFSELVILSLNVFELCSEVLVVLVCSLVLREFISTFFLREIASAGVGGSGGAFTGAWLCTAEIAFFGPACAVYAGGRCSRPAACARKCSAPPGSPAYLQTHTHTGLEAASSIRDGQTAVFTSTSWN